MAPVKPLVLVGLSVVSWVFMVAAMADDEGLIDPDSSYSSGIGLFKHPHGKTEKICDSTWKDQIKAAQAFAVMAVLLMSFAMIAHILALIPQVSSQLPGAVRNPMILVALHGVAAVFLLLVWAIIAGWYDTSHTCGRAKVNPSKSGDLSWAFAFFIICFVFEIILAAGSFMFNPCGWTITTVKAVQDGQV
eukprot:Sspe_Gene.97414::Locus_71006_Transcript_1_1_Confidence_1.000_Length_676::g.97414::m.97414